jgi:2'-deoxynucleoside 5'-phosphate N-hydrolase
MKIYFSCSITGGRNEQSIYQAMVDHLISAGYEVPTASLADQNVLEVDSAEVYKRDVQWVTESDVLIAEVSTPSHGVGYEIALALQLGKPVLCCYREGLKISKMISGNDHPMLKVESYRTINDLKGIMDHFILNSKK